MTDKKTTLIDSENGINKSNNKHKYHILYGCNGKFGHLPNCFNGKSKSAKAKRGEK